jgi:hypothetical protein
VPDLRSPKFTRGKSGAESSEVRKPLPNKAHGGAGKNQHMHDQQNADTQRPGRSGKTSASGGPGRQFATGGDNATPAAQQANPSEQAMIELRRAAMTSLLTEAMQQRQQEPLKQDAWFAALSQLTGAVDIDGIEHVSMSTIYDLLRVPTKRRDVKMQLRIAEIMRSLGWWSINERGTQGRPGSLAAHRMRGFERKAATTPSTISTPPPPPPESDVGTAPPPPAAPGTSTAGAIVLNGDGVELSSTVGQEFIADLARVYENLTTASAMQIKYELTPHAWEELTVGNQAVDRELRRVAERRKRSGITAMEMARAAMPAAQIALKEVVEDRKSGANSRVAAAREIREAAKQPQEQQGIGSTYPITIMFGHGPEAPKPINLLVENPKPPFDSNRQLDYYRPDDKRA